MLLRQLNDSNYAHMMQVANQLFFFGIFHKEEFIDICKKLFSVLFNKDNLHIQCSLVFFSDTAKMEEVAKEPSFEGIRMDVVPLKSEKILEDDRI